MFNKKENNVLKKNLFLIKKYVTLGRNLRPLYGEMSEWLKEHAWNACKVQAFGGSNPSLSAIKYKKYIKVLIYMDCLNKKRPPKWPLWY